MGISLAAAGLAAGLVFLFLFSAKIGMSSWLVRSFAGLGSTQLVSTRPSASAVA